jgi:hypothetical protein
MKNQQATSQPITSEDSYPLKSTAALINDRLGLFLSQDQQRGLATGLLIGVAVGAAVIAWNIGSAIRRRL